MMILMNDLLPVARTVTQYEKICRIGEGTYGIVYKARNRHTGPSCRMRGNPYSSEGD